MEGKLIYNIVFGKHKWIFVKREEGSYPKAIASLVAIKGRKNF
jgi:hypothetical protein